MQKRFTAMVPQRVLTKLGWGNPATWAEVFDFLSDKGMLVYISRAYSRTEECFIDGYNWAADYYDIDDSMVGYARTWERAAEEAVMKCLEILS